MKNKVVTHSICQECAQDRGGCCKVSPDYIQMPITPADVDRLMFATKLPKDKVCVESPYSESDIRQMEDTSPWLAMVSRHGLRLPVHEDGTCVFLRDGVGCSVGEFRPQICKTFPFFLSPSGEKELTFKDTCLAVERAKCSPKRVMVLLEQTEKGLREAIEEFKRNVFEDPV